MHAVDSGWAFNGDYGKPTFSPSVLVRWTRMTEKGRADWRAWLDAGTPRPAPASFDHINMVCHSFVTDGQIRFLADSTHALAGTTVALEPSDL
jgi:hypothetical protein